MIIKNAELETVCGITSKIPDNRLPEVAFAGKSNVGKSSLINALMNRRSLARISSKPGKTQTINFYNINGQMYLVDLPGYGYATAGEEIKAQWGTMIENYLHTSRQLAAVFLLIDIRHDPSENDRLMYHWMLEQGFAPMIIATKSDKLKRSQVKRHIEAIERGLSVEAQTVIQPFSAMTKDGRSEIWDLMETLTGLKEQEPAAGEEKHAGEENSLKQTGAREASDGKASEKTQKPRWKAVGHPTGKKTKRNRARKAKKQRS